MTCWIDPNLSQKIVNEETVYTQTAMCIKETCSETKVDHLELQITTHRIRLYHAINKVFNFEMHYEKIANFETAKRGFFTKMTYKLCISYGGKTYDVKLMDRGNFEKPAQEFEQAYKMKQRWEVKRLAPTGMQNSALSRIL